MSRTENQFNAFLSSEFKKHRPHFYAVKISDKFKVGMSDFIAWFDGKSAVFECKFVSALPKSTSSLLLSHPFSPGQRNFFRNIESAGTFAFGLVGIADTKVMAVVTPSMLDEDGNIVAQVMYDEGNCFKMTPQGVVDFVFWLRNRHA